MSVIVLPGIGGIIIQPLTVFYYPEIADQALPFLRNHEINEFGGIRLSGRRTFRLAKGVIGVNQKGIAAEENIEVVHFLFGGHPGAAVGLFPNSIQNNL